MTFLKKFLPKRIDENIKNKLRKIDDEIPKPIGIRVQDSNDVLVDNCVFRNIPTPILDVGGKRNVYRRIRAY